MLSRSPTRCMLGIVYKFLSSVDFFRKFLSGISLCVSNGLDPDQARRFVQIVCKCYKQTTQVHVVV